MARKRKATAFPFGVDLDNLDPASRLTALGRQGRGRKRTLEFIEGRDGPRGFEGASILPPAPLGGDDSNNLQPLAGNHRQNPALQATSTPGPTQMPVAEAQAELDAKPKAGWNRKRGHWTPANARKTALAIAELGVNSGVGNEEALRPGETEDEWIKRVNDSWMITWEGSKEEKIFRQAYKDVRRKQRGTGVREQLRERSIERAARRSGQSPEEFLRSRGTLDRVNERRSEAGLEPIGTPAEGQREAFNIRPIAVDALDDDTGEQYAMGQVVSHGGELFRNDIQMGGGWTPIKVDPLTGQHIPDVEKIWLDTEMSAEERTAVAAGVRRETLDRIDRAATATKNKNIGNSLAEINAKFSALVGDTVRDETQFDQFARLDKELQQLAGVAEAAMGTRREQDEARQAKEDKLLDLQHKLAEQQMAAEIQATDPDEVRRVEEDEKFQEQVKAREGRVKEFEAQQSQIESDLREKYEAMFSKQAVGLTGEAEGKPVYNPSEPVRLTAGSPIMFETGDGKDVIRPEMRESLITLGLLTPREGLSAQQANDAIAEFLSSGSIAMMNADTLKGMTNQMLLDLVVQDETFLKMQEHAYLMNSLYPQPVHAAAERFGNRAGAGFGQFGQAVESFEAGE